MDGAGEVAFVKHLTVLGKLLEEFADPHETVGLLFFLPPFSCLAVRFEDSMLLLYHCLGFYMFRGMCLWGPCLDSWASFHHSISCIQGPFLLLNIAIAKDWGQVWPTLACSWPTKMRPMCDAGQLTLYWVSENSSPVTGLIVGP